MYWTTRTFLKVKESAIHHGSETLTILGDGLGQTRMYGYPNMNGAPVILYLCQLASLFTSFSSWYVWGKTCIFFLLERQQKNPNSLLLQSGKTVGLNPFTLITRLLNYFEKKNKDFSHFISNFYSLLALVPTFPPI